MESATIKKKILIVEDDASLLHGLVDKFVREGFQVFSASDGTAGLASALANHPDVILLDIVMARMDGLTMLQKLRQSGEWGKGIPVVFLTNLSPNTDEIMARITQDEPAFYLVKSDVLIQDVVTKVNECLAAKK